jgi:hypothetical protein
VGGRLPIKHAHEIAPSGERDAADCGHFRIFGNKLKGWEAGV